MKTEKKKYYLIYVINYVCTEITGTASASYFTNHRRRFVVNSTVFLKNSFIIRLTLTYTCICSCIAPILNKGFRYK